MKKITLIAFMALCSFMGYAQFPEGFEGTWPPTGWGVYNNGIGNFTWAQSIAGNPTQPPYENDHAAYLQKDNVLTGLPEDWLVTPQFAAPDNPQLRFWSRLTQAGNQGSIYRIMVSTDADQSDLTQYTLVQEWTEPEINPIQDEYIEKIVALPAELAGQQIYVAFVMLGDDGDRWLIDYVSVVEECLAPENLSVTDIGLNSVVLNWENPGGASSWEIEVVDAGDPPVGSGFTHNGDPTYLLEGLDEDSDYKFYVRALCADGGVSPWAGPMYFSTVALGATCNAPIVIPSALPYSTSGSTANYGDDYSGIPGTNCGTLEWEEYLNGDDVVYSYTAAADGVISIDMTGTEISSGLFVYGSCDDIGVNCLEGGIYDWNEIPVSIPEFAVTAGQTYYIVISTWANPQSTLYNLVIQQVNCDPPVGLPVTSIGQTSVELSWTNPTDADSWEIVVQAPGAGIPAGSGTTVTTNTNYLVDGLTEATPYEYYVRADCGDGTFSAWAGPYLFNTTICEPTDQCTYTFILTDSFGDGWNDNTMTVSQNGITLAVIGEDFTDGNGPFEVEVQMCNNLPFQLYWNQGGSFAEEVGVSIKNSFNQVFYTKVPGEGVQNSLLYEGTIDCDNPMCVAPTDLNAENETMTTADLSWGGPETGEWEYYVVEAGEPAPTETTPGTPVTESSVTATGLTAATNYEYYVRYVCSDTETTEWAGPFAFNTTVCNPEDQCVYTFEMISTNGWGWEGNTMTIFQAGVPITTIGETFEWGESATIEVPLCPDEEIEVVWNLGGWGADDKALTIHSPYEDIFTKPAGTGMQGDTIYTGVISCDPPACFKPQNLNATDLQLTSAVLGWDIINDATQWEIVVLPVGSPAPTEPGIPVDENSYLAEGLTSGTTYVFYVRTNCGDDGYSLWSGPFTFTTAIENDDCDNATTVPVNEGVDCVEFATGTLTGSTSSNVTPSCFWNTPEYDAWYEFTATSETHSISINNQQGGFFYHTVYESSDCGTFTELQCGFDSASTISGLIPGNTYLIQVYLDWFPIPSLPTSFEVCVLTPATISTNNTEYTVPELVTEVLVTSTCAQVSNITWSTGTSNDWGGENGIAMFTQGTSEFPLQQGIVLSTGNAMSAPGPNTVTLSEGYWPGDEDLFNYIQEQGIDPGLFSYNDATVLEFDFVPLTDHMSFPFVFASEEYGTYQCDFSDAFAFFLTDEEGNTVNLAVIPDTDIPVSVVTIRDAAYNSGCESANVDYFDTYYEVGNMTAAINFNGHTIPMTAEADVIIGQTYHIKLVIADRNDNSMDSAVFIGPFDIGDIDLGVDLTVTGGNAVCAGEEVVLESGLNPDDYAFTWFHNDEEMEGETGPDLVVTEPGEYTIEAQYLASTCSGTDTILVEFYDPIEDVTGDPVDLAICNASGFGEFDLSENTDVILEGTTGSYTISYHLTAEDAQNNEGALDMAYENVTQYQQTIHVRIYNEDTQCVGYKTFDLIVQDLTPEFTLTEDLSICEGTTATLTITAGNYDPADPDVTYSWTFDGEPMAETTSTITVSQGGIYEATVDNIGCSATQSVTVTEIATPVAAVPEDVNACDSYVLEELAEGNNYFTQPGGQGTMLSAGDVITSTQVIYVLAQTPTNPVCTHEGSFTVTVTPTPDFDLGGPYVLCDATNAVINVDPANFDDANAAYAWTFNGDDIAHTGNSLQATDFGVYGVTVTVNGCSATKTVEVIANEAPVAITHDESCEDGNFMLTALDVDGNFNPDTATYVWTMTGNPDFSETGQQIVVTAIGEYTVTVTTEENCVSSYTINVESTSCDIQRGISPNNDNKNDSFDLSSLDVRKLSIFNRYGAEVFSFNGEYTAEWAGQDKGGNDLPTGTYFYMFERDNGESRTGWIYINREE